MKEKQCSISVAVILTAGILLRFVLLIYNKSLYCDEIMLLNNVTAGTYQDMFQPLVNTQSAPPIFLCATKFLLQIFNSGSWYIKDFVPKIIPFIAGIACLPAFLNLAKKILSDKIAIIAALFVFTFNPLTINYCIIYKQYSLELFVGILLLQIFYDMIFCKKFNKWFLVLIFFAPWLSYSSFFITFPLIFLLFFVDKKTFIKLSSTFIISGLVFYFSFLHDTIISSYSDFNDVYKEIGYLDLSHPLRLPIRLGQLFSSTKLYSFLFGCLLIFLSINYAFAKNPKLMKFYYYSPILCVLTASLLHGWALVGRLLLFLLPIFVLLIVQNEYKLKNFYIILFCSLNFIAGCYYTYNPIIIHPMTAATSGRDMNTFLRQKNIKDTNFISDSMPATFNYYFGDIATKDKTTILTKNCNAFKNSCQWELSVLPKGEYYFIAINKINDMSILPPNTETIAVFKYSSILHFVKN